MKNERYILIIIGLILLIIYNILISNVIYNKAKLTIQEKDIEIESKNDFIDWQNQELMKTRNYYENKVEEDK